MYVPSVNWRQVLLNGFITAMELLRGGTVRKPIFRRVEPVHAHSLTLSLYCFQCVSVHRPDARSKVGRQRGGGFLHHHPDAEVDQRSDAVVGDAAGHECSYLLLDSSARLSTSMMMPACSSRPFVVMLKLTLSARRGEASIPWVCKDDKAESRISPVMRNSI